MKSLRAHIISFLIPSIFSLVMHVAVFHGSSQTEFSSEHHQTDSNDHPDHEESEHKDSDVCVAGLVHIDLSVAQVHLKVHWQSTELSPLAPVQAKLQIAAPIFSGRAPPLYA